MTTTSLRYQDLDPILSEWVARHHLHHYTECKGEEIRTIPVIDDVGDAYHIYARPNETGQVAIGADLHTRAGRHAFYRERKRFHHLQLVPLADLASGLDAAMERVKNWIVQSGHTRA